MTKRVAYFSLTKDLYGGERMLLNLLTELDRNRFVPLVVVPAKGRLTRELNIVGVEYVIRALTDCRPILAPQQLIGAMLFLKRNAIDLIHVNSPVYWRPMEILAAWLLRIPVLTHAHIAIDSEPPFLRYSSAIVTNSRHTREASKGPRRKMHVVYNSVDLRAFENARDKRSELGVTGDEVTVLFIGQLKPIKGVELFIDMASRLVGCKAIFLIVGDSRDEDYLAKVREKMKNCSNIVYLGYRTDSADMFMSADIVVVPSQWEEPFGLVIVEAGACGKPVISTQVGGIPEIIDHGRNGLLVKQGDLDALVSQTERLIANAALRNQLGINGRQVVQSKFSNIVHADQMQNIYERLLVESGSRSLN